MDFLKLAKLSTANSDRWFKLTPPQAVAVYKYLTEKFKTQPYEERFTLIEILHDELQAHFEDWDLSFGNEPLVRERRMFKK